MRRPAKKSRPPRRREKVLIVLQAGGLVEVFANENIDVHSVNRLALNCDETPELANMVDAYHEANMPRSFRELYWPNKLRHVALHENKRPEGLFDALFQLSILRGLRAERESKRSAPAAISRARRATA